MSADELVDQKRMFQALDGLLERSELIAGFRDIYGEDVEAEVDTIMQFADLNGNGELDYSEWLVAKNKLNDMMNGPRLRQAFEYFDKDHSGTITLDELKNAMGQICLQFHEVLDLGAWENILAEAEENNNGKIDFD